MRRSNPARRFAAAYLSVLLAIAPAASALPVPAAALPQPPSVRLERPVSGAEAVEALGASLPAVAASHGKSAEALEKALRGDARLAVDTQGRLFYREKTASAGEVAAMATAAAPAGLAPLDETFTLHSLPGSKRVIFLDFDGYVMTGTAWNTGSIPASLQCPPWDIDGSPGTFGDTERTRIQQIWQRVAEDYAPFDVDVTTEQPAEDAITRSGWTDEYYGMRVLISPLSSYFGGYGGLAYVGVFDSLGATYKPALVFPEKLGNGEKAIGEAAAHECGHTLSLLHDGTTAGADYYLGHGTGETGWAPIMGCGYYSSLTQWSKGEYGGANNQEDDLASIVRKGCAFKADDWPDATATAPRLAAGATIQANGLVSSASDVDVVSFAAGSGPLSISVTPASLGANLDVSLQLLDAEGATVAAADAPEALAARIDATVAAGTYYLAIRGAGKPDALGTGYTDYGSVGKWAMVGTVTDPGATVPPIAIADASLTAGVAPLSVVFDASQSSDPDGSVVSCAWDFGDGDTAVGTTATHVFTLPGTYNVGLTITDNDGLTARASVAIVVGAANRPPSASFTSSAGSYVAPASLLFDAANSSDADGSIVSWTWDFGDGGVGSGATVSHTYERAGTYTVRLSVADDDGATASTTANVVISAPQVAAMHVDALTLSIVTIRSSKVAKAAVRIVDGAGKVVPGATVTGTFSGVVTGTGSATTGTDGIAVISSKGFRKSGVVTFAVGKVSKTGYIYDAAANTTARASVGTSAAPSVRLALRKIRR